MRPEKTTRSQVLIYYANETSPQTFASENYIALLAILRTSSKPLAAEIAASIVADAQHYPAIVQRDIDALLTAAHPLGVDLAIFTNSMALKYEYLFYRAETTHTETRRLPALAKTLDTILATSPLSRPDIFHAALLDIGSLYPPDSVDAVLITNSHGSADMALMPRVNIDLSLTTSTEVLTQLSHMGANDSRPIPTWATLKGTNKLEFWRVISEVSTIYRIRFPLIFREACASGLATWSEFYAVPKSVDTLAHSAMDNLSPSKIDYAVLAEFHKGNANWVDQVASALRHYGIHVDTRRALWLRILTCSSSMNRPFTWT